VASVFAAVEEPDRLGSMALYFLIAVAITGPYALMRVRRIRAERAEFMAARQATADAALPPDAAATTDSSESTTGEGGDGSDGGDGGDGWKDDPDDLVAVIDAIEAGRSARDEEFEVRVAARPRLNGRPADAITVDALVQDALRRSGVIVVADETSPDGRVLTCRPGHT